MDNETVRVELLPELVPDLEISLKTRRMVPSNNYRLPQSVLIHY